MLSDHKMMEKPDKENKICELCNNEILFIKHSKEHGDVYDEWEKIIIKYEKHIYIDPLAGGGSWLDYTVCPGCFLNVILPELIKLGLPTKKFVGYIS